jgi:hypothetical protein
MNKSYKFRAVLTAEQCLAYYEGAVTQVLVRADSGEKIQLSAHHFRSYITHFGLSGYFELTTTLQGKFISLKKIN